MQSGWHYEVQRSTKLIKNQIYCEQKVVNLILFLADLIVFRSIFCGATCFSLHRQLIDAKRSAKNEK